MQITRDSSVYRTLKNNLNLSSSQLNDLYVKSSTGVEVAKASDKPSIVGTIIGDRSDIVKSERYIENCKNVQDNLSSTEVYVDSLQELMSRAQEIATAAANSSLSESDLATYANEVKTIQQSVLDLANTQVDGKYIFAGYSDQSIPFSGTPVVYSGTTDKQMVATAAGSTTARNIPGNELFTDPVDIFSVLDNLTSAIQSGDISTISSQLSPIANALNQIADQQSTIGTISSRMDDLIAMHESSKLITEDNLSNAQDADLTEVLSDISKMELSVKATMQVTARVSSLSLLDYL